MRALYQVWAQFPDHPLESQTWCIPKRDAEGFANIFKEYAKTSAGAGALGLIPTDVSVRRCARSDLEADLKQAIENPTMPMPGIWKYAARRGRIPGG
jgi:hypothetical protein